MDFNKNIQIGSKVNSSNSHVFIIAEALILLTEWKAFRSPDFEKIKQ